MRVALWTGLLLAVWLDARHTLAADAGPLTFNEVLRSLSVSHPKLTAAEAGVEGATGQQQGARGGFDPKLSLSHEITPLGYYRNQRTEGKVDQALPWLGAELFAGYRLTQGDVPGYKGELDTLSEGEVRAGAALPLWKNRSIDERRAKIAKSDFGVEVARCDLRRQELELHIDAADAYFGWVLAGRVMDIQTQLLEVALKRESALEQQSDAGSIAPILVVDNTRLILERQAKLVEARQKYGEAAAKLSLYLRDQDGNPLLPSQERLPTELGGITLAIASPLPQDVERARRLRPEFCALENELRSAEVSVRLADNQVAPALNARAYVSRDFGQGPDTLRRTELVGALTFEMPLALRSARGEARTAQAKRRSLLAYQRWLADSLQVDIQRLRIRFDAAAEQLALVRKQRETAQALADAERKRFFEGASDLVHVNIRELAEASAAQLETEAAIAHELAFVQYRLATGSSM